MNPILIMYSPISMTLTCQPEKKNHSVKLPDDTELLDIVKGIVHTIIHEKFGLNTGVSDCQILIPTNSLKEKINEGFQGLNQSPFIQDKRQGGTNSKRQY